MKTLGLIGGTSPASTAIYYRRLNELARERLGGAHSSRLVLWSLEFGDIDAVYAAKDWLRYEQLVVDAGRALERAGADGLMICSNTTHLAAAALKSAVALPLIDIIDALAAEIDRRGARRPLLLATPFVMEPGFYRDNLSQRAGVDTLAPDAAGREECRRIIFDELSHGRIVEASRARLLALIEDGRRAGVDSVILGCTEFSLILSEDNCPLPVFDTMEIHAVAASDWQIG